MIKQLKLLTLGLLVSIFFIACGKNEPTPAMQGKLYTKTNMWIEKGRHLTVNYGKSELIPVNSQVEITGYSSKAIFVKLSKSGQKFTIINVPKFTKTDINGIFDRTFSKSKVNLKRHSRKVRNAILDGYVVNGMTKSEVILARGYPPVHATHSLKQNTWRYWKNRFVTENIRFKNNKVTER